MDGLIINYQEIKLRCGDVNCIKQCELNCEQCPLANHGKLNPGEFKILKPKDNE